MILDKFYVNVPEGDEKPDGRVLIPHNTVYTIELGNGGSARCDASVKVDGKEIGVFRIDPRRSVVLERPTFDTGRFTFFESGTSEAKEAGIDKIDADVLGLIEVEFRPEHSRVLELYSYRSSASGGGYTLASAGSTSFDAYRVSNSAGNPISSYKGGVTGLTGKSSQSFYDVPQLMYNGKVYVVYLRLVAGPRVREMNPGSVTAKMEESFYKTAIPPKA